MNNLSYPEIWKTAVIAEKEHIWYSVSNYGRVASHLRPNHGYDPSYKYIMTLTKASSVDDHLYVKFVFPNDFFVNTLLEGHVYNKTKNNKTTKKRMNIHQLVMNTFKPIDEYPPKSLKLCWDKIPKEAKNWIKQTVFINHIDHDPTNNTLENLEYVTPQENTRKALKHYGGSFKRIEYKSTKNDEISNLDWALFA